MIVRRSDVVQPPSRVWSGIPKLAAALGAVEIVVALAWWAVVFAPVIGDGVLTPREAGLCLLDTSGLCQAIAVLCTQNHLFGLRVYSPTLLWAGCLLSGAGCFATAFVAVARR